MTGNEPSSSLAYSTQAELKSSKAWLDLAHFHPYSDVPKGKWNKIKFILKNKRLNLTFKK